MCDSPSFKSVFQDISDLVKNYPGLRPQQIAERVKYDTIQQFNRQFKYAVCIINGKCFPNTFAFSKIKADFDKLQSEKWEADRKIEKLEYSLKNASILFPANEVG